MRTLSVLVFLPLLLLACQASETAPGAATAAHAAEPYLGILFHPARPGGAFILEVFPDSPAEKAGLKRGDRIMRADGVLIGSSSLRRAIETSRPGDTMNFYVRRGRRQLELSAELEEIPEWILNDPRRRN